VKIHKILKTWKFRFCTIQRESFFTVMRNSNDLCMNNLAVRGEGQDVVTHLTTAGSDDEYSIRVSVREESGVGLLTAHRRFEPSGLAEGEAEAEVGARIPVAGGRV